MAAEHIIVMLSSAANYYSSNRGTMIASAQSVLLGVLV
jgi:hypothetical protein